MKTVHLIIPDLFLPKDFAAEMCAGLSLPGVTKLLARGAPHPTNEVTSLENRLGELFLQTGAGTPIAAIGARYDGLPHGNWLRADPVNLHLRRDQMVLSGVLPGTDEAQQICASLNEYFAGQGMIFSAPHPQRWYVQVDVMPRISTTPLTVILGRNIRGALPAGEEAALWHQRFNEIQMLLYAHPVNEAREARGEPAINSLWFWGEGEWAQSRKLHYHSTSSDDELVAMFTEAADIPFSAWSSQWQAGSGEQQLLVWSGLRAALREGDWEMWRDRLQQFEAGYAQPIWQALQSGRLNQVQVEVLVDGYAWCTSLTRHARWAFWRRVKPLSSYSIV